MKWTEEGSLATTESWGDVRSDDITYIQFVMDKLNDHTVAMSFCNALQIGGHLRK